MQGGWFCINDSPEGLFGYQSLSNHEVSHLFVRFAQALLNFDEEFRLDNLGRRLLARLPDFNLNPWLSEYVEIEPILHAKSLLTKRATPYVQVLLNSALPKIDSHLPPPTVDSSECYKPRVFGPALKTVQFLLKESSSREANAEVETLLLEYVNVKLEQSANSETPGFIVNGRLLSQDFGDFISERVEGSRHAILDTGQNNTLESLKSIWLSDLGLHLQRCCPGVQWSARNKRDSKGKNQRGFIGIRWKPGYEPIDN